MCSHKGLIYTTQAPTEISTQQLDQLKDPVPQRSNNQPPWNDIVPVLKLSIKALEPKTQPCNCEYLGATSTSMFKNKKQPTRRWKPTTAQGMQSTRQQTTFEQRMLELQTNQTTKKPKPSTLSQNASIKHLVRPTNVIHSYLHKQMPTATNIKTNADLSQSPWAIMPAASKWLVRKCWAQTAWTILKRWQRSNISGKHLGTQT